MFGLLKSVSPEAHRIGATLQFISPNIDTTLLWLITIFTLALLSPRTFAIDLSVVTQSLAFYRSRLINECISALAFCRLRLAYERLCIPFKY